MKKLLSYLMIVLVTVFLFAYSGILKVNAADAWATITIELHGITNVYTNPGEDATTSVTISWHSAEAGNKLYFTTADDTEFANATIYDVTGVYDDTSFHFYENVSFYKCTKFIDNLTPGTDYIYKILSFARDEGGVRKAVQSEVKTFRTGIVTDYSFAWISDIHAIHGDDGYGGNQGYRVKLTDSIITLAEQNIDDIDFIVTTGDEVWRGSQYSNWTEWSEEATGYTDLTGTHMWCGGIGNHEYYCQFQGSIWNYYPKELSNSPSSIYSDHRYYTNELFNAIKAVPDNGPTNTRWDSSAYWFLAGSVLFILQDSMDISDYDEFDKYQSWFRSVVAENEGKYQYLVVGQHYAWIDPNDGLDKGKQNSMSRWRQLFDECGVDLAISGHEHTYYRTVPMKGGQPCEGGTTYLVAPQIGNRTSMDGDWNGYWVDWSTFNNKDWVAKSIDDRSLTKKSGATIVNVTSTGLNINFMDASGEIKDSYTLAPKRQINCEAYAEAVGKSLNATVNSQDNSVEFVLPTTYANLVKSMTIKNGSQTLGSLVQSQTLTNKLTINNMLANNLYELTVDFVFMDDSTYSMPYSLSTYPYFGEVYKFEPTFSSSKANFSWSESILPAYNGLFNKYEVYADDVLVGTVDRGTNSNYSIEVDRSSLNITADTVFKLKGLNNSGNTVFVTDVSYHIIGDLDMNGSLTSNDLDIISGYIFNGRTMSGNMKALTDVNKDGKIDYIDMLTIWLYNKNDREEDLYSTMYSVVFKDLYGNTVCTKNVTYGTDLSSVSAPTLSGYTFAGWSESVRYITKNMTVYAVYTKNN